MIKYGHTIIPHYRGTSFSPVHACTSVSESSNSVSSQNGITISSNMKTIFRPLIYLQMFVVDTYSSFFAYIRFNRHRTVRRRCKLICNTGRALLENAKSAVSDALVESLHCMYKHDRSCIPLWGGISLDVTPPSPYIAK
jgi:hypothetical protein